MSDNRISLPSPLSVILNKTYERESVCERERIMYSSCIDTTSLGHLFTAKCKQVRIFSDHYVSNALFGEISKLRVCFIWCHYHLNTFPATCLEQQEDVSSAITTLTYLDECQRHFRSNIHTPLKTIEGFGFFTIVKKSFSHLKVFFSFAFDDRQT